MSKLMQKQACLKEAVNLASNEISNLEGLVNDILTKVTIETLHKYQQKVNVGVQDSVSDLLETFKQKVAESVFDVAKDWRVPNKDTFLFPRGCRYCFTKGSSTIIAIEQEPQIRSLCFRDSILNERRNVLVQATSGIPTRICLSLPFVVFILHFSDDIFRGMYCGWRTAPLQTPADELCRPVLPNMYENLSVCLGRDALNALNGCENISQITEAVIGQFWQSQFNNDLSDHWWQKQNLDQRISTAYRWSRQSEEDPLFILSVPFQETGRSIRTISDILTAYEQEPDENSLRHRLVESIDKCAESLFVKMTRYFKHTKFERHHPKDIKEQLAKVILDANNDLVDLVIAMQHEIDRLGLEVANTQKPAEFLPQSDFWSDYSC